MPSSPIFPNSSEFEREFFASLSATSCERLDWFTWPEPFSGLEYATNTMEIGARLPKRYLRLLLAFCSTLAFWSLWHSTPGTTTLTHIVPYPAVEDTPLISDPPDYERYREYEDALSLQGGDDLQQRKYLYFANHAWGCGWGNVLQEMLMSALLAHDAQRSFVWDDYTWNRDGRIYTEYNDKRIPSRIPLSTMITGHILGINITHLEPTALPAISSRVYNKICPRDKVKLVERATVNQHYNKVHGTVDKSVADETGEGVLDAWLSLLNSPEYKDEQCVEVTVDTAQVFDIWVIGSTRVQDIWHRLVSSPILQNWSWSPLVHRAFQKNSQAFESAYKGALKGMLRFGATKGTNTTITTNAYPALDDPELLPVLTLHVRRGDFVEHCKGLSKWSATYSGLNSFPQFVERDGFVVPKIVEGPFTVKTRPNGDPDKVESQEAVWKVYQKHCYPEMEAIVRKVREVVTGYEKALREGKMTQSWFWEGGKRGISARRSKALARNRLKKVYIMTNGNREWLNELKEAIIADARASKSPGGSGWEFEWEWEGVTTSRDLDLGWEEKPVAQALDMYVGQRSQIFVGNGFSSLTANIVMMRMKNNLDPVQTRFW